MSEAAATNEVPLRMQFELSRDDDPSLYDDLVRFKKGTKRINRLRFLAHEGMVAQATVRGGTTLVPSIGHGSPGLDESARSVKVTAGMFDGDVVDE